MGQKVDNGLNNINLADSYIKETGIANRKDYYEDKKAGTQTVDGTNCLGYSYVHGAKADKIKNTTMDNFEEYLKNKQEKAKEAGIDEASKEREDKENAKEIIRSLSSEEIKQLKMMGIDVSGVALGDIMGMVNTMRGNAHREEMKTLMADIAAANGDMDKVTVVGGNVKVAGTEIELDSVSVSDVTTAKPDDTDIVSENQMNYDKTGIEEKSSISDKNIIVGDFLVSDNELVYIMKNSLSLTKDNMYKAHYSGSIAELNPITDKLMQDMLPQIEKVIEQAGFDVDKNSMQAVKFLIDNELPVSTDNLKIYIDYQTYQGKNISDIDFANAEQSVQDKAEQLYNDVKSILPGMAYEMVMEGKTVTIASIISYSKLHNIQDYNLKAFENYKKLDDIKLAFDMSDEDTERNDSIRQMDIKAVTVMRQVEEIRMSMTMEASFRLIKQDINIDTREISKVLAQLKDVEQQMISQKLQQADVPPTKENISLYKDVSDKVQNLGSLHARVLAAPVKGGDFSVNGFYSEESVSTDTRSFEAIRRSYEAVGTAPRADMGDSINKAFSNVKNILAEMNMPVNYETERAVRILGYNSLEITQENIEQIINIDRQVNDLINTFYPEAVLGMIKDGINPLDMPVDELNKKIKARNYNKGVSEADNFASYLRDMENMGQITAEERESYIGIYRAINKLEKSGDREAGWLFANGSRLTVRNLVSAMRSRRASGMDVSVDETFGMLEQIDKKGKDIEAQIAKAFENPDKDSDVDLENDSVALKSLADVSAQTEEFMIENQIELTAINVSAVNIMTQTVGGIYQLVSEILSKMKFTSHNKEEMVDEETENITDSLNGQDVEPDFALDSILESLRGSEEMSLKYEDLRDKLTEMMYGASVMGNITSMDISAIKTVNAGFNIMSKMAKRDRYQIPVQTENGIKVMNLTINHDDSKKGTIQINIFSDAMGKINANIKVAEDGSLAGYIVSSTSEGNYMLKDVSDKIMQALNKQGYDAESLSFGRYNDVQSESLPADEEKLYKASVTMVKALSKNLF